MRIFGVVLTALGTLLLASEAIAPEQAKRWEQKIVDSVTTGRTAFGDLLKSAFGRTEPPSLSNALSRRLHHAFWPALILSQLHDHRWTKTIYRGSLVCSIGSWFVVWQLAERIGWPVLFVIWGAWLFGIGTIPALLYGRAILSSVAPRLERARASNQRLRALALKILADAAPVSSSVTVHVGMLVVLVFSFPFSLYFAGYILILALSMGFGRFGAWKEAKRLGNVLIFGGLFLSFVGIVLSALA